MTSTSSVTHWPTEKHVLRCIAEFMRSAQLRDGFTLIEALAALAISSVIIVTTVTLIHTVAGNFDRGTRGVDAADGLTLALQRLASDFSAARYTVWTTQAGLALAFKAERADGEKPAQILFVTERQSESESLTDEVVSLTIEQTDEATRLVRRRAVWTGPNMQIDHVSPQDAVVLLEGDLDISFLFGGITPGGGLVWSTAWVDATKLPRFVRLVLRDRATGANPVGEADFIIRADAPLACGRSDAGTDCLSHPLPALRRRAALERLPG
jgi:prepilin-type N-terminal cleavage/methylation domain-containing protein